MPGPSVDKSANPGAPGIVLLPPLILHPFSGGCGPEDLLEGSRASLALQGLIESNEDEPALQRKMLMGRYHEVRMLLFLGKDLFRWLQQCAEQVRRHSDYSRATEQSFAVMLVEDAPAGVKSKLEAWGVTDRRSIFSRALGLHSVFQNPPPPDSLSPIFLRNYHRYADHAYVCYLHGQPFQTLDPKIFRWELYASEEYARLLSEQWEETT